MIKPEYEYAVPSVIPEIQLYSATVLRAIEDVRIGCKVPSPVARVVEKFHISFSEVRTAIVYIFARDDEKLVLKHLSFIYGDDYPLAHTNLMRKVTPWIAADPFLGKRFKDLI